ncbi:hypothetical protein [Amycolatopsis sp. SID8362]|uniref:hypothetical protein n=1 Tax=Amycolatopsis sp. SID8362 TaxID=2690346 RepID=UPI001368AE28|nr:hypothetical protein [Amycolatopsis sp. SID8362]NBH05475.1 hypothetical protein [Amycolatopsis sp. SID8362]NED42175.1 hypothetical protein [Amycolatopsis sp. SID8362]
MPTGFLICVHRWNLTETAFDRDAEHDRCRRAGDPARQRAWDVQHLADRRRGLPPFASPR